MPTASSTYLNKIYQYIGTTDANYTNGLFYRCVQNGSTYSWKECETQHRLTASEMADIMSTLPGAPTQQHSYSTSEQVVGKWLNNKPLYEKTYDCGVMPNNTTKLVPLNISMSDIQVMRTYGIAYNSTSKGSHPLPYSTSDIYYISGDGNISITTTMDRSTFNAYITIQYTKTTD